MIEGSFDDREGAFDEQSFCNSYEENSYIEDEYADIDAALDDIEEMRIDDLEKAKDMYDCDEEALKDRFAPGSYGYHELVERAFIVSDQFEHLMINHISCVIDEELYRDCCEVSDKLYQLYQKISNKEFEALEEQ